MGITMGLIRPHVIWASEDQMAEVVACLRAGVSNLTGGPVRELDEVAGFRGLLHKVLSTPPFVLVWGTLSQTGWSGEGPRFRKFSGGKLKFLQRLTTVGGKSKISRWLWGLE
jgi:hypothetical protein